MLKVRKRNGSIVEFNGGKIEEAMEKAFRATGTPVPGEYIKNKMLMNIYALMRTEDNIVEIESIQDAVEQVLSESGYFKVSKAYVLYRSQRKSVLLRNGKSNLMPLLKALASMFRLVFLAKSSFTSPACHDPRCRDNAHALRHL